MGTRERAAELDFSAVALEEVEAELKEAAVISMGTEISEADLLNIMALCDQVRRRSHPRSCLAARIFIAAEISLTSWPLAIRSAVAPPPVMSGG